MPVVDSYSETNSNGALAIILTKTHIGQSFDSGVGNKLSRVKFSLKKNGTPVGNMVVEIYAHTGTYGSTGTPTGDVMATSDNVNASILTTTEAVITFTFSGANQIALTASTNYVAAVTGIAGDITNSVQVGVDTTSPTHGGNGVNQSSGVWAAEATQDYPFYVETDTGLAWLTA